MLVTAVAAMGMVLMMLSSLDMLAPGNDGLIHMLRLLSLVVLPIGTAIVVWNAWTVLRSGRRWPAKVWSVLLALSCLGILWVSIIFRVIGYSANY